MPKPRMQLLSPKAARTVGTASSPGELDDAHIACLDDSSHWLLPSVGGLGQAAQLPHYFAYAHRLWRRPADSASAKRTTCW